MIIKTIKVLIAVLSLIAPKLAVSLLFRLFCNPNGRSAIRKKEIALFNEAQKSHIVIKNKKVCVYKWSDGNRPVLLIHGWESRGLRFTTIIKKLIELGFSPVTFDMPGHGDSEGKNTTILECHEICIELQKQCGKFEVIIAHSFGVPCTFYAIKNSLSANKIITIGGLSDFIYLLDEFSRALDLSQKIKERLKYKIEGLFHPISDIWEVFSVTNKSELVTQPILIIHDIDDDVVQLDQAKKIREHFDSQVSYHETSGYGHRRILHQEEVVQRIVKFIV